MRVLVCGGRNYNDGQTLTDTLNGVHKIAGIECLIEGGASGADRMAKRWAKSLGIPVIEIEPNWDFYGQAGGPIRNEWMIKFTDPDLVIAFPGNKGTRNMVEQARNAGIEVRHALPLQAK